MLLNLGYGLRLPTNIASAASTSLAAMPGIEFDYDATLTDSYPGTGVDWNSVIASPASGAAQADYLCKKSGSNPLTYVGSGQSAYWDVDNVIDIFPLNKSSTTQSVFLRNFHKSTEGQKGAIVVAFRTPAVWTGDAVNNESLFCGTENNAAKSGFKVGYDVNDKEVFVVFGKGIYPTNSAGYRFRFTNTELDVSTDYLLMFNVSYTGGNTTIDLSINSIYKDSVTLATSNTTDATGAFKLCNDDSATHIAIGTRFYHFSMYNDVISTADKYVLSAALQARHNRVYIIPSSSATTGGIKIDMPHTNWIGLTEVSIYDDSSTEVSTSLCTAVAGTDGKSFTDFTGIDAGEFAVDSNYASGTVANINDGNDASLMWSTNTSSGLIAFFNFNTDITITKIRVRFSNGGTYGIPPNVTLTDIDNNIIAPVRKYVKTNTYIDLFL